MRGLKFAAFALLVLVIVLGSGMIYLLGARDAEASEATEFKVTEGLGSAELAQQLEARGLIRNSFAFYLYLKLIGGKVLPGIYELSAAQSGSQIAGLLATGRVKVTRITVIEGWRATQMEEYFVGEKRLGQLQGFAETAVNYEGYLFPDTYEIKVEITIGELIELMRQTFTAKTQALRLTPETVILASIVEREAKSDSERSQIAGVYVNRINRSMPLEADPTVQYAKGSWASITVSDYRSVISPYNTYLNEGWPPGPICSPGLASLEAAANPAKHDYLYFFHAKGQTHFSKTLAEHRAKVAQHF